MRKEKILELVAEIKDELSRLERLVPEIVISDEELSKSPKGRKIYEESLALKLHNFYTGCERVFQKVADDLNGGVPRSFDWHRRLLQSMSLEIEQIRPPVISGPTARALEEFLAFRHIVRNIYAFEIDSERLCALAGKAQVTYKKFREDVSKFIRFLDRMAK